MQASAADDGKWHIELFGTLRAVCGETAIHRFRTTRSAVLLAFLANRPQADHSREMLGEMLWPDEPPKTQRNRLRHELLLLRRQFGGGIVQAAGHRVVALGAGHTSDTAALDDALNVAGKSDDPARIVATLQIALALHQGSFLEGFYDNWIVLERERRESQLEDTILLPLIKTLEATGRVAEARWVRAEAVRLRPEISLPTAPPEPETRIATRPAPESPADDFLGRRREFFTIRNWIAVGDGRLFTVTGLGGIGKTRLTREAVRFAPDARFVALTLARTRSDFWEILRTSLGVDATADPRAASIDSLNARTSTLLVLDNLEQFATIAGECVDDLLRECPNCRIVATSRRPLLLPTEEVLPLAPLPEPDALALFLRQIDPIRPARNDADTNLARQIVGLLEGIPLAIELAAARALVVDLPTMHDELARRLKFLKSVRPRPDERHKSLTATLSWSFETLSPDAQSLFARLSVFAGNPTLSAIRSVCGDEPPALDSLEELALHHLLETIEPPNPTRGDSLRYGLRAIVREFAAELWQKDASPEGDLALRARHATHFRFVARQIGASATRNFQEAASLALSDRPDLAATIDHAAETADADALTELVDLLPTVLSETGIWTALETLLTAAETHLLPLGEPNVSSRILALRAALARRRGDNDTAARAWTRRYEITIAANLIESAAGSVQELVMQTIESGELENAATLLELWKTLVPPEKIPRTGALLEARLFAASGALSEAVACADRAWRALETTDAVPRERLLFATYLAEVYVAARRFDAAEALVVDAVALCLSDNFLYPLAVLAKELAAVRENQGRLREAAGALLLSHKIHRSLRSRHAEPAERALASFETRHGPVEALLPDARNQPWQKLSPLLKSAGAESAHDLSTNPV